MYLKIWLHLALFQDRSYPSFPDHTQVVQQKHEVTRAFSLQASRFVNRTQRLTALVLIILEHISVQFETLDFHRLITGETGKKWQPYGRAEIC